MEDDLMLHFLVFTTAVGVGGGGGTRTRRNTPATAKIFQRVNQATYNNFTVDIVVESINSDCEVKP